MARSILIKWHADDSADDVVVTTSHATHSGKSNSLTESLDFVAALGPSRPFQLSLNCSHESK